MIAWVEFARPAIGVASLPGVLGVRSESVVGLEGGLDDELKGVLLRGGLVRLVASPIDSVHAQIDAADRMARAKHPRRPRLILVSLRLSV